MIVVEKDINQFPEYQEMLGLKKICTGSSLSEYTIWDIEEVLVVLKPIVLLNQG